MQWNENTGQSYLEFFQDHQPKRIYIELSQKGDFFCYEKENQLKCSFFSAYCDVADDDIDISLLRYRRQKQQRFEWGFEFKQFLKFNSQGLQ